MKKSTQWLLTSLIASAAIWSCAPPNAVDKAKDALASAAPGTGASALPGGFPGLTGSGNCAAVLQCAVDATPALASSYNPLIAKPNSTECQLAATGALATYPQCKK